MKIIPKQLRCQIVCHIMWVPNCPGAQLSALLCWCQIVCFLILVSNCPFAFLVPNCPLLLSWCQIVCFLILLSNCPFAFLVPNCPFLLSWCPVPSCPGAKLSGPKLSYHRFYKVIERFTKFPLNVHQQFQHGFGKNLHMLTK